MRGRPDTAFLDDKPAGHARLSASGSSIWLNCESAPALALTCPPRSVGEAARIGTVAHWLGEQFLHNPDFLAPLHVMLGGQVYDVTTELMLAVSVYVAYVQSIIKQATIYGIEAHVDLGPLWAPFRPKEPVFGTADFWAIVGDCLIVVDYKNGRGKFVSPEENPQATFYALGVYLALDPAMRQRVRRVRIVIVQPNSEGEHIRGWDIPAGDLVFWGYAVLKPAADRIFAGNPKPFVVGPWCWFCAGALMCPAKARERQDEAENAFPAWDEDELAPTTHFDPEMSKLADRHYSRRTPGARQFLYSGRKLVLRNAAGTILFGWMYPDADKRMDGQTGYNCAIFRNESQRKASDIILEAEKWAERKWGKNRFYTYVDPTKVKGNPPGNCFLRAGWKFIRTGKSSKHLLVKEPA